MSVDLSQAGTRSAGRNLYRRVAAAARAVRAGMAAVTGWTWQAISRGPLGNMLSIALALGIGGAALYGGIAGRGSGGIANRERLHARDGIPRTEQASATAVLPSAIGAWSPAPPLTSDREAYARWLYRARVIYLVDSQEEADALRSRLADDDERRILDVTGGRPPDDMILVAGTEEEQERAAEILNHHDGIRAALNLPPIGIIDLRSR